MTIKERIKSLCKKHGISMNKLEQDLDFGTGYISKLDKSTPNTKKMQLIADYFHVSLDYLLKGKEGTPFSNEMAHLVGKIRNDKELSKALLKYFEMSDDEKKHVIDTINMIKK